VTNNKIVFLREGKVDKGDTIFFSTNLVNTRSLERGEAAAKDIMDNYGDSSSKMSSGAAGSIIVYKLDLSSLTSVRECARNVMEKEEKGRDSVNIILMR
jgi:hypothetical protein